MKKNFNIDGKKSGLTLTQKRGLIWFSTLLVVGIAAVVFGIPKLQKLPEPEKKADLESEISEFEAQQSRPKWQSNRSHRATNEPRSYPTLPATAYDTTARPTHRQKLVVDINTADTLTLQLLHGIGPAYARRIVKYRAQLGGFVRTEQLLEVYGFTNELYQHILPYLTLSTDSIRQIDINSVSLKQLIRHPYIDYYQARDLIALRNSGQQFTSADDLRLLPTMDDSTLYLLLPYLSFGTVSPSAEAANDSAADSSRP
ncbi:MAG: helix-hairpin-helix domain-containing protein [Bacteroidales bacterium]|nr:helix-hairpin-helix domain-containing protein [Bacteroidales bacterium]